MINSDLFIKFLESKTTKNTDLSIRSIKDNHLSQVHWLNLLVLYYYKVECRCSHTYMYVYIHHTMGRGLNKSL